MSGASGLIGTSLVEILRRDGHEVIRLVRREPAGPDQVRWDPAAGRLELKTAPEVAPLELHPGAKRYYDEQART